MQKLYCFVDETGQDTAGKLFIVTVAVIEQHREELLRLCEDIERASGKHAVKWHKAMHESRLAYIRQVFSNERLRHLMCYSVFHNTRAYDQATVQAIASAIRWKRREQPVTALVYVDGLAKAKRLPYGTQLRRLGIHTRRVQGVARDESNALIRMVDAVAGFLRDVFDGKADERMLVLYERARRDGFIEEV